MRQLGLLLFSTMWVGAGLAFGACSADGGGTSPPLGGPTTTSTNTSPVPTTTNTVLNTDATTPNTGVDPNDKRQLTPRKKVCDAAGVCTCLRLAMLGTLDSAAHEKDSGPFVDWLNGNSGGTAVVTMVTTKPTLDAAFLGNYDILLVANVSSWTFSPAEKAAVEQWVRAGGGIVTLTGFVSTPGEPAASSQLIEFSGVKYTDSKSALEGAAQNTPVYYQGGTQNLKNCMTGWGGDSDKAVITAAVPFTPQADSQLGKLTLGLSYVGAFIGFGVVAPPGATIVATDPTTSQPMGVAYEVDGTGRIFAFGDEWVIFKNQWTPTNATPGNTQKDQYNPCYVPAAGDHGEFFHSVATLYQVKQFWYNAIRYVAPPNECEFKIEDPDVILY